jgi:cytochrome P450
MTERSTSFFSPATRKDPYDYYKELRHATPVLNLGSFGWLVSRRKDVLFVLSRADLFSSSIKPDVALLGCDPPSHSRLRRLANRLFSEDQILPIEATIRAVAEDLVVSISRQWDLVGDFAVPFPILVMAERLRIEPERWPDLKRWSQAAVSINTGLRRRPELAVSNALADFDCFFRRRIDCCRQRPGNDLISGLMNPQSEDEKLTDEEILSFSKLLLIAAGETTTNLIGNAILALLRNPVELDSVLCNLSLIPRLVEETLRYDSPVQFVLRNATQDVRLCDTVLPAGVRVVALLGSANRDEDFFHEPDRFDLNRFHQSNVAFGAGVHYCLGAMLARVEARIALAVLVPLLTRFEAAENLNEIPLVDSIQLRGPKRLLLAPR